jgi:predicted ArsR family transcriptional regulator
MVKVNALSYGTMLKYFLDHGHATIKELADESGLHPHTVREWLAIWHVKLKIIHIGGWDRNAYGRPVIIVYHWGAGRDAPRPKKTQAERAKTWRANRKMRELQKALTT